MRSRAPAGARAAVRLRLRPHVPELTMPTDLVDSPFSIADAVLAYKPGIPGDQVAAAGALFASAEGLDRARRAHAPPAPRRRSGARWVVAMRAYAALIAELSGRGGRLAAA